MTEPKATLRIKLNTPSNQRWSGALPIEVRDAEKLVLKARGISDEVLEVPAGRYFVTAVLPNGDQSTVDEVVVVNAGDSKQLEIPVSDLSFPPPLESIKTFTDSLWELSRPVTQYFFRQSFAIVRGNWLAGKISGSPTQPPLKREPTTRSNMQIPFSPEAVWIEIESSGRYNYVAVPIDEGGATTVEWALDIKSDKLSLKVDFHDGELNSFVDFIQNDKAFEARSISQTMIARPDSYATKRQSSLRATLGAYVLIRANLLDGLDTWTSKLISSSPWLPDGPAIRVEYLARNGRHQDALDLLLNMPGLGAPLFRSGIGYLADRAKTYARLVSKGRSDLRAEGGEREKLEQLATVFDELAASLDMAHSFSAIRRVERV
jgi:hypothetical protein